MDNMLEMYLYETNTLLEQLDELLIEAEKKLRAKKKEPSTSYRCRRLAKVYLCR